MVCGPLTLKNLQGSWGHGPVGEYGSGDAMKAIAEAGIELRRNRSNFGHAYAVFQRFYVVLFRV